MRLFKKKKHTDVRNKDPALEKACVRIFNGQDGEWLAKVRTPLIKEEDWKNRKRRSRRTNEVLLQAECILELRKQNENDLDRPWVIFAPLKNQSRMKLMIEKCTELGVGAIILAKSDRMDGSVMLSTHGQNNDSGNLDAVYEGQTISSDDDYSGSGLDKLILQAIEASEQCERLSIPRITNYVSSIVDFGNDSSPISTTMKDIVEEWCRCSDERKLLICRERGDANSNVLPVLDALHDNKKVAFVIGPEGGWSQEEEALFDHYSQSDKKESPVQCVSLGSSVLRAETACMMAVGAWALVHD
jgi:16S rRNA (uracil1498-N3)-methyltransferase